MLPGFPNVTRSGTPVRSEPWKPGVAAPAGLQDPPAAEAGTFHFRGGSQTQAFPSGFKTQAFPSGGTCSETGMFADGLDGKPRDHCNSIGNCKQKSTS